MARAMRVRRDDVVEIIAGKDSGKRGKVIRTEPRRRRVYVEGLNIQKRHTKPKSVKDAQKGAAVGGVVEFEGPIHISNVMLLDPKDSKPTRVGVERRDGKRIRIARRTNGEIDR